MSTAYLLWLAAVVLALGAARLLLSGLPVRPFAARVPPGQALLILVGGLGLAFHCTAMFFRDAVGWLPAAAVDAVRGLGPASAIWYAVPALLLLLGLRRQHPAAVGLVALALLGVGVTMYDGSPVTTHLATIFVSVVVTAGVLAVLARPPWAADRAEA